MSGIKDFNEFSLILILFLFMFIYLYFEFVLNYKMQETVQFLKLLYLKFK